MLTVSASNDTPIQNGEYKVVIKDAHEGHVYEAYQIFAGDYADQVLSSITWGTGFQSAKAADFLRALQADEVLGSAFGTINPEGKNADMLAGEIANVLDQWTQPDNHYARKFAEILHSHTVEVQTDGTKVYKYDFLSATCTQSGEQVNNKYEISNLDSGYYLIKDQDGSIDGKYDYYTRVLMQVVGIAEMTAKGEVPTVDKKVHANIDGTFVENEDVSLTDSFYFKLTGTFPTNYADYKSYNYEFADTMNQGMELDYVGLDFLPAIEYIAVERGDNSIVELYLTTNPDDADHPFQNNSLDEIIIGDKSVPKKYNLLAATDAALVEKVTSEQGEEKYLHDVLITYNKVDGGADTLTIKFLDLKTSLPGLTSTDKLIVKYKAKLNHKAIITNLENQNDSANINKVVLKFSNNPQGEGTGETPEADAKVYSYELNIHKINEAGENLPGAQFMLYQKVGAAGDLMNQRYAYAILDAVKNTDGTVHYYQIKDWITVSEEIFDESNGKEGYSELAKNIALSSKMTDGVHDKLFSVHGEGLTESGTKIIAENNPDGICLNSLTMESGADGKIVIKGLDATTYFLQELKAPAKYNKLLDAVAMTITVQKDDATGTHTYLGVSKGDGDPGSMIEVKNFSGNVLPSTGGIGTTIFYVVGGILVAAALVLLVTKKRMSDRT